jgi:hypothetical protein
MCDRVFGTFEYRFRGKRLLTQQEIGSMTRDVLIRALQKAGISLLFSAVALSTFSCKDEVVDPNADPIVFPETGVSYSKHVEALFQQRCSLSGCHSTGAAAAGLALTMPSYNSLMNHQPRLVNPGFSNNSLLVQRIDGRLSPRMPYNSQPLTANQISGIKKWIDEGALNN